MKLALKKDSTSQSILLFIQDSSSTVGAGLAGLAFNTSGLTAYYARPRANPAAITLATQTVTGAYSAGGFVAIDGTNMPGFYRLDLPDAALATGVDSVVLQLRGAANMAPLPIEIQLTSADLNDAAALGLSRIDATVGSRATQTTADAIKAKTDNLPASPAAVSDCITSAGVRSAVGLSSANLDAQFTSRAS